MQNTEEVENSPGNQCGMVVCRVPDYVLECLGHLGPRLKYRVLIFQRKDGAQLQNIDKCRVIN